MGNDKQFHKQKTTYFWRNTSQPQGTQIRDQPNKTHHCTYLGDIAEDLIILQHPLYEKFLTALLSTGVVLLLLSQFRAGLPLYI